VFPLPGNVYSMGGRRASATGKKERLEYSAVHTASDKVLVVFKETPSAELLLATAIWAPDKEPGPFEMGLVTS
jgi:hypothetical protein